MNSSHGRLLRGILALLAMSALLVALVIARILHTDTFLYRGLIKNLGLAWVPLIFAMAVHVPFDRLSARAGPLAALVLGAVWLVFLPNAFYLVTDLMHLRVTENPMLWLDMLVLSGFAWTGLALGLVSLYLVHQALARVVRGTGAWVGAAAFTILGSFGVYVGRFGRWNTWDVFVRPDALVTDIVQMLTRAPAHANTFAFCAVWSAFLLLAYTAFYAVAHAPENN